jgi:hypothetical protein
MTHTHPDRDGALPLVGDEVTNMNDDVSQMDDFQVVAERQRVMAALAALTDQYRALNQELQRRETLQWMLAR